MRLERGDPYRLRDGFFIFSRKSFKEVFNVGDIIFGPVRITGRITAIGEKRFLYKITHNEGYVYESFDERVATMEDPRGWRRADL